MTWISDILIFFGILTLLVIVVFGMTAAKDSTDDDTQR